MAPETNEPKPSRQLSLIKKDLNFSDAEALEKALRLAANASFSQAFLNGLQSMLQVLVNRMNVVSPSTPDLAKDLAIMYWEDYVRGGAAALKRGESLVDLKIFQKGPNNPPNQGPPPAFNRG